MKLQSHIVSFAMILIAVSVFGQGTPPNSKGSGGDLNGVLQATGADDSGVTSVPKRDRLKSKELPQISVIDKFLSIESVLSAGLKRSTEDEWVRDYNELYQRFREDGSPSGIRGGGKSIAYTALALGVKASDGVLALKARNIEALKNSAEQIEVLARKLGATEGELGMADTVKIYADKNQWFNAFLALGRLQRDLLGYLRSNPEKTDLAALVIVGGWLQGGRCVTHVIDKNYTEDVSNVLREQRLVDLIRENLEKVAPVYLREPVVAQIIRELPDIREKVNVGLKEPVKHENVKWLHLKFDELVTLVMTPDPPPVEPKEPAPTDAANQVGPGESARPSAAAPSAPPTTASTDISTPKPDVKKSMVPAPLPGGNAPYRSAVIQTAPRRSYWPLAGGALGIAIIAFFVLRWKVGRRAA
jgi:hypothetical protein